MMTARSRHALFCLLALALAGRARAIDFPGGDKPSEADSLLNLNIEAAPQEKDYSRLKASCRGELRYWRGVEGAFPKKPGEPNDSTPKGWKWDSQNHWLSPIGKTSIPANAVLAVPEKGRYRIWLRSHVQAGIRAPVTLRLAGANSAEHVFALQPLTDRLIEEQARQLSLRVEDEPRRAGMLVMPLWIWQYWDAELAAGPTTFSIASASLAARVSTLLVTQSLSFVPNLSAVPDLNNLNKIYYRFRVLPGAKGKPVYTMPGPSVTFHWWFVPPRAAGPLWYSALDVLSYGKPPAGIRGENGRPQIAVGAWTDWINATFCSTAPGPWFTVRPAFNGIEQGMAEVQIAWFPHERAVLKTVAPRIVAGQCLLAAPSHGGEIDYPAAGSDGGAIWGMVAQRFLDHLRTAEEIHDDYLRWSRQAVDKLGLPPDHPRPKKLGIYAPCAVVPQAAAATAQMLAMLGVTASSGLPPDVLQSNGLRRSMMLAYSDWGYLAETHDPCDPTIPGTVHRRLRAQLDAGCKKDPAYAQDVNRILLGDEIGAIVGGEMINYSSDCRAHFQAYLREVLTEKRLTPAFFGVADVRELEYLDRLPKTPTRFESRLYYHCQIFKYRLTADYYRHTTQAVAESFPRAATYANFSPHPALLGGQNMNGSDWFNLARMGGASMAWGEDWASRGSWGYNGLEIVSFEGAWVECAARKHHLPSGFYAVASCGAADHKMLSLVARGIGTIELYGAEPVYAEADASNSWSDSPTAYEEIARGTSALGPADTILAEGRQPPRKVALLYNRTHEIWCTGADGMLCDRALTFAALGAGHYNADLILVEDLVPQELAKYAVLYVNGFNLPAAAIPPLRRWVEKGGVLVAAAATGAFDEYNAPLAATAELFGAQQTYVATSRGRSWHPAALKDHQPLGVVRLQASALTPALEMPLIGVKAVLTPTTGRPVGTFDDGSCAAVVNVLGKGRTLLYGFLPGILYKGDAEGFSSYHLDRLPLVTKPARAALGEPAVDITAPQMELALFEHESGLAVTMNNFAWQRWQEGMSPATLSIRTQREIKNASSSFRGPLSWKRQGDRLLVTVPVPAHVDVIVLK
jgi:hypothetical protein